MGGRGVTLLVDTHVLLWAMSDPGRLSSAAEEALADIDATLHVSTASAWEIATKHRLGKLPQAESLLLEYARNLERWFAFSLPVDEADALLAGALAWEHRDPFDRMIAAQAIRRGWPLVSGDQAFDGLSGLRRIW